MDLTGVYLIMLRLMLGQVQDEFILGYQFCNVNKSLVRILIYGLI